MNVWRKRKLIVTIAGNYVVGIGGAVCLIVYSPNTIDPVVEESRYFGPLGVERSEREGVYPLRRHVFRLTCPAFVSETQSVFVMVTMMKMAGSCF